MSVAYRDTDPDTSRTAAEASPEQVKGAARRWLLDLLTVRASTDEEMWTAYRTRIERGDLPRITDARLRHCRKDLERAGLIMPTGEKRLNKSGSAARVWGIC